MIVFYSQSQLYGPVKVEKENGAIMKFISISIYFDAYKRKKEETTSYIRQEPERQIHT